MVICLQYQEKVHQFLAINREIVLKYLKKIFQEFLVLSRIKENK